MLNLNTFFVCLFVCFHWQIGCDFSCGNWGCFPTSLNLMCWIVKWLTCRPTFLSPYYFLKMISSSRGGVRQRQCANDLNLCSCWLISILVPHVVISNLWHSSKVESNVFSIKKKTLWFFSCCNVCATIAIKLNVKILMQFVCHFGNTALALTAQQADFVQKRKSRWQ